MTVISEDLDGPGADGVTCQVEVTLIGPGAAPVTGYTVDGHAIVGRNVVTPPPGTGVWQLDLVANSAISPAGSVYRRVVHTTKGVVADDTFDVPPTGGPYVLKDRLTDPPAELASSALAAHAGTSTQDGAHGTIVHTWAVDGWSSFDNVVVNQHGTQDFTPSVVSRRGRVTGSGSTDGDQREWFLRQGTEEWIDGQVTSIWHPPSQWDSSPINRPQMGHVHRAQQVPGSPGTWRAFVVFYDMTFSTSNMLANTWQADGSTLTLGSGAVPFTLPDVARVGRTSIVHLGTRVDAFDVNLYRRCTPAHLYGLANGGIVNIAGMGDASFNLAGVAVDGVDPAIGQFHVAGQTGTDVNDLVAAGTVTPVGVHKSVFPRAVASLLVGNDVYVKIWRPEEPEPNWGDPTHVAKANPPTSPPLPAGPGQFGVALGHLHTSSWAEFGDITFTRH